jgi:HAE1 family hydrophobic/amphiphilic exporter-1
MASTRERHLFDRPVGVLSVLAALLVLGGMTLPGMRISLNPPGMQAPMLFVNLNMDTESSSEALEALTRPAEEVLRAIPGVDAVDSRTKGGNARLFVWPDADTPVTQLSSKVSDALDANRQRFVGLTRRPTVGTWSFTDSQPLVAAAFGSGTMDTDAFNDLLEREVIPAVMRVPGVAKAGTNQDGNGVLLVAFEPERTTAARADPATIMGHIGASNPRSYTVPSRVDGQRREQLVRVRTADLSENGLSEMPISGGAQLGDLAAVARLPASYGRWIMVNGRPGASIRVYPAPDANGYRASLEVTRVLEEQSRRLGLPMTLQSATHREIEAAAHELFVAGLWGAGFSALFLVLFLGRIRLAFVVCLALPLSMALALLAMACQDNRLNLFSLMGFLLATGMVIDNAIVVGESLLRAREASDPRERSLVLRRAVGGVAMAIVVSTLTTIALFLPMAVTGDSFMRPVLLSLGKPIMWSLAGSLLVALILVPMAFPRLYPRGLSASARGRASRGHASWLIALERAYGRLLAWFLLRPLLGLVLVLGLVLPGLAGWWFLPKAPGSGGEEERQFELNARMRGSPTDEAIAAAFARWQRELEPHYHELGIVSTVADYSLDGGSLSVYLEPIDHLGRTSQEVQAKVVSLLSPQVAVALDEHIGRAASQAVKLPDPEKEKKDGAAKAGKDKGKDRKKDGGHQQVWGDNRLDFRIVAPDEAGADEAWIRLRALLAETPGVLNPGPQPNDPPQEVEFSLSRDAEERGWRADTLATQVTRYGGTRQVGLLPDGWSLRVGPLTTQPRTVERLLGIEVRQPGNAVADRLENLVERASMPSQTEIYRRDGLTQRNVWCSVDPAFREQFIEHLPELAAKADLPAGTRVTLSRWDQRMRESRTALILACVMSIAIIYLLMGILYESVVAPLALMVTVPTAIVSVLAAFNLARLAVDQMVLLGLFLLVGIVINHGVVLVDRIGALVPMARLEHLTEPGRRPRRALLAIAAASRRRFTPVLLTSLTTIAGAVPMAFGHGRIMGSSIAGLGWSLGIGLSCALLFTLLMVPIVYEWLGALRVGILRLARSL